MYSFHHLPAMWLEGVTLPLQDWRCKRGTHHRSTVWWEGGLWHVYEVHTKGVGLLRTQDAYYTSWVCEQESRWWWVCGLRLNIPALSGAFAAPFNTFNTWDREPCTQDAAYTSGFWESRYITYPDHLCDPTTRQINTHKHTHQNKQTHKKTSLPLFIATTVPTVPCLITQYLLTTVYDLFLTKGPYTCTCVTEPLCYTPDTSSTLLISDALI